MKKRLHFDNFEHRKIFYNTYILGKKTLDFMIGFFFLAMIIICFLCIDSDSSINQNGNDTWRFYMATYFYEFKIIIITIFIYIMDGLVFVLGAVLDICEEGGRLFLLYYGYDDSEGSDIEEQIDTPLFEDRYIMLWGAMILYIYFSFLGPFLMLFFYYRGHLKLVPLRVKKMHYFFLLWPFRIIKLIIFIYLHLVVILMLDGYQITNDFTFIFINLYEYFSNVTFFFFTFPHIVPEEFIHYATSIYTTTSTKEFNVLRLLYKFKDECQIFRNIFSEYFDLYLSLPFSIPVFFLFCLLFIFLCCLYLYIYFITYVAMISLFIVYVTGGIIPLFYMIAVSPALVIDIFVKCPEIFLDYWTFGDLYPYLREIGFTYETIAAKNWTFEKVSRKIKAQIMQRERDYWAKGRGFVHDRFKRFTISLRHHAQNLRKFKRIKLLFKKFSTFHDFGQYELFEKKFNNVKNTIKYFIKKIQSYRFDVRRYYSRHLHWSEEGFFFKKNRKMVLRKVPIRKLLYIYNLKNSNGPWKKFGFFLQPKGFIRLKFTKACAVWKEGFVFPPHMCTPYKINKLLLNCTRKLEQFWFPFSLPYKPFSNKLAYYTDSKGKELYKGGEAVRLKKIKGPGIPYTRSSRAWDIVCEQTKYRVNQITRFYSGYSYAFGRALLINECLSYRTARFYLNNLEYPHKFYDAYFKIRRLNLRLLRSKRRKRQMIEFLRFFHRHHKMRFPPSLRPFISCNINQHILVNEIFVTKRTYNDLNEHEVVAQDARYRSVRYPRWRLMVPQTWRVLFNHNFRWRKQREPRLYEFKFKKLRVPKHGRKRKNYAWLYTNLREFMVDRFKFQEMKNIYLKYFYREKLRWLKHADDLLDYYDYFFTGDLTDVTKYKSRWTSDIIKSFFQGRYNYPKRNIHTFSRIHKTRVRTYNRLFDGHFMHILRRRFYFDMEKPLLYLDSDKINRIVRRTYRRIKREQRVHYYKMWENHFLLERKTYTWLSYDHVRLVKKYIKGFTFLDATKAIKETYELVQEMRRQRKRFSLRTELLLRISKMDIYYCAFRKNYKRYSYVRDNYIELFEYFKEYALWERENSIYAYKKKNGILAYYKHRFYVHFLYKSRKKRFKPLRYASDGPELYSILRSLSKNIKF